MTSPSPSAPEPSEADWETAQAVAGGWFYGPDGQTLSVNELIKAIALVVAAARTAGLHDGRLQQLTADDRRNLAAVYGYEAGLADGPGQPGPAVT
ncbi:hypothetical protein [Blastococcus sp. TF02A-26]|uniref:hypothetical protein n=1 Tax=Blastococcus sp. TF02A-26 TaxID=2250577 RepID=UPI000DE8454D|nr:hypothetical protein [Blastococcus sp. TF02A-26]RBY82666.1 hypothetical protein DQ240_18385 [Blastococcus sp. TF02A-26]